MKTTGKHLEYEYSSSIPEQCWELEFQWKHTCLDLLSKHVSVHSRTTAKVLDVGCGRGDFLKLLSSSGYKCFGIDPDPECVRRSSKLANVSQGYVEDLMHMFQPDEFDMVTALHVLEHTYNPVEAVSCISYVSKQFVLLAVPNLSTLQRLDFGSIRPCSNDKHVCGWDHSHFANFLENICGLTIIDWGTDVVRLPRIGIGHILRKLRLLKYVEYRLLPRLIPYCSNSVIALCRVERPLIPHNST
ncbi:methyltransferase [subsurface metagenome]